jgi:phosphoribosylamine--glycine ligase
MGAFSPSKNYTEAVAEECYRTIYKPTMDAMNKEGRTFKGVIYFGLMLTPKGPRVIEYNARFGDPETQAVLPRLKTDFVDIINAVIDEKLDEISIEWDNGAAVCIVLASGGYPTKYESGKEIFGLDHPAFDADDLFVYHAGTKAENGKIYTAGGRVLGVTATGKDLDDAIAKSYKALKNITFDKMHYRNDIGRK